jgi:putative endonuclease
LVTCLPAGRERCPVKTMYIIYTLKFITGRIYIGMTSDLKQRLADHKRGHVKSTKNRGKYEVIIIESCPDRKSARLKEKYWKSGYGKERLKVWGGSSIG